MAALENLPEPGGGIAPISTSKQHGASPEDA
jgi:hypothetical protein